MIAIVKRSLKDLDKLEEFKQCINKAMHLTETKRTYLGKFGYEPEEVIEWWRKKATKRYEKLINCNNLRTELELWEPGVMIDIIR